MATGIGCGCGDTMVEIKRLDLRRSREIELMSLSGTNQQNPLIDRFVMGDFGDSSGVPETLIVDVSSWRRFWNINSPWEVVKNSLLCCGQGV